MATSSQRRLQPTSVRKFGSGLDALEIPNLTELQTRSYEAFLQEDIAPEKRKNQGLESVFKEIFPVESYDKTVTAVAIDLWQADEGLAPSESRTAN